MWLHGRIFIFVLLTQAAVAEEGAEELAADFYTDFLSGITDFISIPVPPPIPQCVEDPTYRSPHTTESQIENFFEESLASLGNTDDILAVFEPRTVLCVGCSKGIGRANACHWAGRQGTDRVISLATTNKLVPASCPFDSKIKNVVYNIAKEKAGRLSDILESEGVETIDLVLLSAVRDLMGPMRNWQRDDLEAGFRNNVAGHHAVWLEAREYLSPDLAVVMGITSVAAETRYFLGAAFTT